MHTGDSFLIEQAGVSVDSHLWIVISDPIANPESVVLVNCTSFRPDKDQACILEIGDHPWIRNRTCIEYRRCKVVTLADLDTWAQGGLIKPQLPVSVDVMDRILAGVMASWIPLGVAKILEDQGMLDS